MEIEIGSHWRDKKNHSFIIQIIGRSPFISEIYHVRYPSVKGFEDTESIHVRTLYLYYEPLGRLEKLVLFGEATNEDWDQ